MSVNNHYIPQYYLRGFCKEFGERLWVYDKKENKSFYPKVKNIANICDYYSEELEKHLNDEIESPANKVLDKIRFRNELTVEERLVFSKYIANMFQRVPSGKRKFKDMAPKVAEDLRSKLNRELEEFSVEEPSKVKLVQQRKEEANILFDQFSSNPSDEIWHMTIQQDFPSQFVESLAKMTWIFFTTTEKLNFITSDNPVFYFKSIGIGNQSSELSFPITSSISLWATWRTDLREGYVPVKLGTVKEMNRRTASLTDRFAFYQTEEKWILPFLQQGTWNLNYIR